jgi:hypothetical protein
MHSLWLEKCCVKADAGCNILDGPYEFSRGGWYWVKRIYERGSRGQRKVHRRAEMPCKYDLTGLSKAEFLDPKSCTT